MKFWVVFFVRERTVWTERRECMESGGGRKCPGADWGSLSSIPSLSLTFDNRAPQPLLSTHIPSYLLGFLTAREAIWLSSSWWGMTESEVCHFQVIALQKLAVHSPLSVAWKMGTVGETLETIGWKQNSHLQSCNADLWSIYLFKTLVTVFKTWHKEVEAMSPPFEGLVTSSTREVWQKWHYMTSKAWPEEAVWLPPSSLRTSEGQSQLPLLC